MDLRFFVIYTPQTFGILKTAVHSMHQFSNYRFTLVGNGINDDEVKEISEFCQQSERYNFIDLPGNVTVPHGTALMYLLDGSQEEYFCFMDSDIFAARNYTAELEHYVKTSDVFSACKPLEWLNKASAPGYRGHNTISPSGHSVATTYFAVYKRQGLVDTLNKYKISMERYMREVQVPKSVGSILSEKDKHTWKFNTGKLVNVLQSMDGVVFKHAELADVFHLGGVSRYSEHSINDTRRRISSSNTQAQDRLAVRSYFHDLLSYLSFSNQNKPKNITLHDKNFENTVNIHALKLEEIYRQLTPLRSS